MEFRKISTGMLCPHGETITRLAPAGSKHYMGAYCAQCGRHMAWLPKPETLQRRARLERLAASTELTAFERSFVRTLIAQNGRMSPRQADVYRDICSRHVESGVAN
jgi:hypothetical protein